ncbi:uncharacterized protein DEA37_0004853 [Paragonimus westermani]|uniref:Cilia- and flagella-associated protein 157 n=1 Tax=Paragonimus westermani TaxID=34504 RepID=A0A5J4NXF5_9TREM|nr:uncharacterized protein DEA37_0004853 [Paragonimus westermani]
MICLSKMGHISRPKSLTGSAIRMTEARYVNSSTLAPVIEAPSVDGLCAQQTPSPVNHWTSSSSSCPTNSECTPNGSIHYDDEPEGKIDSTKIVKNVQNHTQKTTTRVRREMCSSQPNRSRSCESDHVRDCVHPEDNFALNPTDLSAEKPSPLLIRPGAHVVKDEPPKRKSGSRSQTDKGPRSAAASIGSFTLLQELGDDAIAALGRDYYVLVIRQLERRVDALRSYSDELAIEEERLLLEGHAIDADKKAQFKKLKARFEEQINESADLLERIHGKHAMHKAEKVKWIAREQELQALKRMTEEQLEAENQALADELNALEVFRANRDQLLVQYRELEIHLARMKSDYKAAMRKLDEKDLAYRSRLKKAASRRITEVASEFRTTSYQRTESTFKRMLAENVSIEEQLTKMANGVARLSSENLELNETFHALLAEQMRLEQDQINVATRSSAAMKTIRNKCENKHDRLCAIRDRLKSRGDWIEQTSSTIAQAARFIQTLIADCPFADAKENEDKVADEQQMADKTEAVIQSVLNTFMSVMETGKSRSKSAIISHEHTVTTIDSLNFVLTVEQDSSYEVVSSEDDNDSRNSEISDPHSSRAEDTELEISEPEDDQPINFAALENDTQVGQTQKTEPTSSLTTHGTQSDTNAEMVLSGKLNLPIRFERLDRIWSEMRVSNLERYGPASKEWRTLLVAASISRRNITKLLHVNMFLSETYVLGQRAMK